MRLELERAALDPRSRPRDLLEQAGDVDAAVRRRVRREPARRLLELPRAAGPVPAAGLVPGDGDVDKALVEVPLLRRRPAPLELELLVRGEELAAANQVKAALETRLEPRPASASTVSGVPFYACEMARVLLAGVDLFFRAKLEAVLVGHKVLSAESIEPPDLVIADVSRIDPIDVAETFPDVPLLGFTNHTDTAGLRRAHEAGFDHVVIKANLQQRATEVIEGLTSSLE